MIRCNLSILLAEQNLKITKVSNDTGISRTTLTSMANNNGQGIQFVTINTLCLYLKVTPNQLLSFVPLDIRIIDIDVRFTSGIYYLKINLEITEKGRTFNCSIPGKIDLDLESEGNIKRVRIITYLRNPDEDEFVKNEIEEENKIIINAFQQLTRPFLEDLNNEIFNKIMFELEVIEKKVLDYDLLVSIDWPNDLLQKQI